MLDLLSWHPCERWPMARITEYAAPYEREAFTAEDVLAMDWLSAEDRLWVVLRPELVSAEEANALADPIRLDSVRQRYVQLRMRREPKSAPWVRAWITCLLYPFDAEWLIVRLKDILEDHRGRHTTASDPSV